MPVPSSINDLSTTAGSNSPPGSESPTTADDYLRALSAFIAQHRDGAGFTQEATVASAATADIGTAPSLYVQITGTTTITSFGTAYNGPRFVRFTGVLTLTHNATTLILPGGANITTAVGDTCVVVPTGNAASGWRVTVYERASGLTPIANGGTGQTTALAAFDALKQSASDTYAGVSEHATTAEFLTGTSTTLIPPVSVIRNGIINIGTAVASTSGTSIDFTGIPAWVKEINIFFDGFSTNGTSIPIVQLGDAGGFENTGYSGSMANMGSGAVSTVVAMSSGFSFAGAMAAGVVIHGALTLRRMDTNKWAAVFVGGRSDAANGLAGGGTKTLSDTLTQIRITTEGGVNTFDAGSVNVSYS